MLSKVINIIIISFIFNGFITSQNVANIQAGTLIVGINSNSFSFRPGYNVGISARIGSSGFFMDPGLYYQKFTISEFNKKKFINDKPSYSLIKINTDGGFENKITNWLLYRIFAGVSLNYVLSIDNNRKMSILIVFMKAF